MIPSSICENREGPFDGRGIQVWKEGTAVMPIDVKYTTQARATGGRDGHAKSLDGPLDVKLTTPKELGGGGGDQRNLGFQFFLLAAMLRASSAL